MSAGFGIIALLSCASACGKTAPDPLHQPHVLLISLDSTRRDLLSVYGHEPLHAPAQLTSPAIDALATDGALFEEASATSSWTLPSHWSILTGEPELVHGVDLDQQRPDVSRPTLAERLSALGYRTAGFYSGPYLDPHFGFDRGFDRYESCYGKDLAKASQALTAARARIQKHKDRGTGGGSQAALADLALLERQVELESHRDVSSSVVADQVIGEFERAREGNQPVFVFAHFFDPHYDHVAPAPYGSEFDPEFQQASSWTQFLTNPNLSRLDEQGSNGERIQVASDRELENVWAGYEGEMAWTDAAVGRILARLDELGLADDTLVVLLSDHGDEFFEHHGLGHRRTLFEEVLAVPLIMRWPGHIPRGVRIEGTVSLLQVRPTILEAVGWRPPDEHKRHGPWGSLWGRMEAAALGDRDRSVPIVPNMARLVQLVPARLTLRNPQGQATDQVWVSQVRVQESWHEGPIKLLRSSTWIEPGAKLSLAAAAQVRRERGRSARTEDLRWIDLGLYPAEPMSQYSTDFSDQRAAKALKHFADVYEQLMTRRRLGPAESNGPLDVQLRALGYAENEAESGGGMIDRFALPAPNAG